MLEEKTACKALELQKSLPFLLELWWEREGGSCAAWCALGTLSGLFCWSCSSTGELGGCGRVMESTPARWLTRGVDTKKGETFLNCVLCVGGTTGDVITTAGLGFTLYQSQAEHKERSSELSTWSVTLQNLKTKPEGDLGLSSKKEAGASIMCCPSLLDLRFHSWTHQCTTAPPQTENSDFF